MSSSSQEEFDKQIEAVKKQSFEDEFNRKVKGMLGFFPNLSPDSIRPFVHLSDQELYMAMNSLNLNGQSNLGSSTRPSMSTAISAETFPRIAPFLTQRPPSKSTSVTSPLDEEAFRTEQLVEAIWAELVRRNVFILANHPFERTAEEKAKIAIFLRDQFPKLRMGVIKALTDKKDFYQTILILALCEKIDLVSNLEERLRKYDHLPSSIRTILNDSEIVKSRIKETKENHRADLPQFAEKMWNAYLGIINQNYLLAYQEMTRFDCSICFDTFDRTDAIYCCSRELYKKHETHFFCKEDAKRHAMEPTSLCGTAGRGVKCPEPKCEGVLLEAHINPLLSEKERNQFGKRTFDAALIETKIENLEKCKRCGFPIVIEISKERQPVFQCENPKCRYKFCRMCGREFDARHEGKKCDEVMTDHDDARVKMEEKLAYIKIRKCAKCGMEFTREGGCNKMTCGTCKTTQCYLCRASDIGYEHFRENGGKCPLYTNDSEVNERDEKIRIDAIDKAKDEKLLATDKAKMK